MEPPKTNEARKAIVQRRRERETALSAVRKASPSEGLINAVSRLRAAREQLDDVMKRVKERDDLLRQTRGED